MSFVAIAEDKEHINILAPPLAESSELRQVISADERDKIFFADIEKRFGKDAVIKMKNSIQRSKIYDAIIYLIALVLFICGIVGVGLNKKMNKVHSKLCLGIFFLAIIFSIYSVGYSGEQGAVGLIFVAPGIGVSCLGITIILWVIQFLTRNNN